MTGQKRERGMSSGSPLSAGAAAAAACSHAATDNNLLKFNALFTADWAAVRGGKGGTALASPECVQ